MRDEGDWLKKLKAREVVNCAECGGLVNYKGKKLTAKMLVLCMPCMRKIDPVRAAQVPGAVHVVIEKVY